MVSDGANTAEECSRDFSNETDGEEEVENGVGTNSNHATQLITPTTDNAAHPYDPCEAEKTFEIMASHSIAHRRCEEDVIENHGYNNTLSHPKADPPPSSNNLPTVEEFLYFLRRSRITMAQPGFNRYL